MVKEARQVEKVTGVLPALCAGLCLGEKGHGGEGSQTGGEEVGPAAGRHIEHLHTERLVLRQAVLQELVQHLARAVTQPDRAAGSRQVAPKCVHSCVESSEKQRENQLLLID